MSAVLKDQIQLSSVLFHRVFSLNNLKMTARCEDLKVEKSNHRQITSQKILVTNSTVEGNRASVMGFWFVCLFCCLFFGIIMLIV